MGGFAFSCVLFILALSSAILKLSVELVQLARFFCVKIFHFTDLEMVSYLE